MSREAKNNAWLKYNQLEKKQIFDFVRVTKIIYQ